MKMILHSAPAIPWDMDTNTLFPTGLPYVSRNILGYYVQSISYHTDVALLL